MQSQLALEPAGIILAGGKSSRMGRDKASLKLKGETLLQRGQRLLSEAGCNPIVVSGQNVGGVSDIYQERGPLGGLHAGLQTLLYQHPISTKPLRVLVTPVDMPKLTVCALKRLLDVDSDNPVYYQHCALPCVLSLTPDLLRYIENCLVGHDGDRSIKRLLQSFDAKPVQTDKVEQLVNTNTPAQWHDALKEEQV